MRDLAIRERGVRSMSQYEAVVFSRRAYAYGIERGKHRVSKRLARRAGPANYLERSVAVVRNNGKADISEGLKRVPVGPGVWILRRLGRWVRRLGRQNVPVRSGKLQRSIQVIVRRRSGG